MKTPFIALALALAGVVLAPAPSQGGGEGQTAVQPRPAQAPALKAPTGGAFTLVDHSGRTVSERDFRGRYMLVYFGYTYCPDICPTDLQTMADAMDALGPAGDRVRPVMVSVDPERDTPAVMADYIGLFHPRLTGLTGTRQQVAALARLYGARYFKLFYPGLDDDDDDKKKDGGAADTPGYIMRHTSNTYLLGPDGRGLATFPRNTGPEAMAREIRRLMNE